MKRPTFALYGRRLAAGSPPSSVPAQTRFTPTICTSTSSSIVRARATAFANNSRVLRDSIAERPVFTFALDQTDEDVFPAQAERGREPVGDRLIKRLLLIDFPALVPGDLDNDPVLAAANVEIVQVEDEILGIVLIDHLKAVVFRHADADQRLVNDAADRRAISILLAFAQIDANERHGPSPYGLGFRPLKRGLRAKIVFQPLPLSPGSGARRHRPMSTEPPTPRGTAEKALNSFQKPKSVLCLVPVGGSDPRLSGRPEMRRRR